MMTNVAEIVIESQDKTRSTLSLYLLLINKIKFIQIKHYVFTITLISLIIVSGYLIILSGRSSGSAQSSWYSGLGIFERSGIIC